MFDVPKLALISSMFCIPLSLWLCMVSLFTELLIRLAEKFCRLEMF